MSTYEFLRSEEGFHAFGVRGQLEEAYKAVAPVLDAWRELDVNALPPRMSQTFRTQMTTEIENLKAAKLRKVVRITDAVIVSMQNKNGAGFQRTIDASREWRECEIVAAVLEQYVHTETGEVVMENYDTSAVLTIRQSRHIRMSDRKKKKNQNQDFYDKLEHACPSCGAEITADADRTTCEYCGADIRFLFFDWQLEGFHLDLREYTIMDNVAEVATKGAVTSLGFLAKTIQFLTELLDFADSQNTDYRGAANNNLLTAILGVALFLFMIGTLAFVSLPKPAQIALVVLVLALLARLALKLIKSTEQSRRKKKIVRYSDGLLRSCIYDELWKTVDRQQLIDFSLGKVLLQSVKSDEQTTTIQVKTNVVAKYLTNQNEIRAEMNEVRMTMQRARYPERKKQKKAIMEEKFCPSCGANFTPDEHNCCAYCGYGLKLENYIWRKCDA